MNIVFIYERAIFPHGGGVERVTWLLAKEFVKNGHSVSYLSVGPKALNKWYSEGKNKQSDTVKQFYISSELPDFDFRMREFLKIHKIDIAIVQGHHDSIMATLPFLKGDVSTMMVFHNQPFPLLGMERYVKKATPWGSLRLKGKVFKLLAVLAPAVFSKYYTEKQARHYTNLVDNVDKFILLSESYIPRLLLNAPDVEKEKLYAINNPNTFKIPDRPTEEGKENIVLVVSRLSNPQKNLTGFIDVWTEFSKLHPDWKALVVGEGEHSEWIKRYALKKKVSGLSFEGSRKNVEDYYKRAKILCMTSAYEGWPMVLAEGMAYGCVPVAYDSFEAVHEIIDSGQNGYLIPPFSYKQMVAFMDKIANDEKLWQSLSEASRITVAEYAVEKIAAQWENIFKKISSHEEN